MLSDTSATRAIKKEEIERNTPGNPVEIPYVQIQEESTDRGQIGINNDPIVHGVVAASS